MRQALQPLADELDAWAAEGRPATLWWRDDDAVRRDGPVERMLGLADRHAAPVFIATPPALTEASLAEAVAGCATAFAIQHGFAHESHRIAPGKSELGTDRPLPVVREEIASGQARMAALFGRDAQPIMAPPWNRIDAEVAALLPAMGFAALSTFEGRGPNRVPGLRRLDGVCDPISWKRGRSFVGTAEMCRRLARHLAARRAGLTAMPTSLVTHVWAQDAEAWEGLEAVLALVSEHPGGRWLGASELLS
ncbi:MAG: hypothetical protein AAGD12_14815 [Pseudomonadota bacterium]